MKYRNPCKDQPSRALQPTEKQIGFGRTISSPIFRQPETSGELAALMSLSLYDEMKASDS